MTIDIHLGDLDVALSPGRATRRDFHRQIAKLEHELSTARGLLQTRTAARPAPASPQAPRLQTATELEEIRDALANQLREINDELARQTDGRRDAHNLLKRMAKAPETVRWASVTTADLGVDGCRTWQSVPRLGPIGLLGNWWRIRMSSGCP